MAVALGLRHAGDPRWFYRLDRISQLDVIASERAMRPQEQPQTSKAPRPRRKGRQRVQTATGGLNPKVGSTDADASAFWLSRFGGG